MTLQPELYHPGELDPREEPGGAPAGGHPAPHWRQEEQHRRGRARGGRGQATLRGRGVPQVSGDNIFMYF